MDEERVHIRILIGLAAVLAALCIGYSLFFVPPVCDPAAVVTTDGPSAALSEVYNGKVHLNSASLSQLESLKGVGSALAKRIVAYRTAHGGFQSVEDLQNVKGIGEKLFSQIRDQIDL